MEIIPMNSSDDEFEFLSSDEDNSVTENIDNENVESPTVQRKAFRNQQQRSLRGASTTASNDSLASEAGGSDKDSDQFGNRRRNLKFRTLGSSGKFALISRVFGFWYSPLSYFYTETEVIIASWQKTVWPPRLERFRLVWQSATKH